MIPTIPGESTRSRAWWANQRLPHYVYTAWDVDGQPLYIGCSRDVARRMRQHAHTHWYSKVASVTTTLYPTRDAAREAESDRIYELQPLANVHHNPRNWVIDYDDDRPLTIRERKAEALRVLRGGAA